MPRNLLLSESEDDSSDSPQQSFSINESYAKRLEHNKAREELHRLEAKYGDKLKQKGKEVEDEDEDEESTSESEDEIGELVTPQLDAKIWQTIAMIRDRRPEVYDATWTGFAEEDDETNEVQKKEKKEKPMYLKDYHRRNLLEALEGPKDEPAQQVTTYAQEQQALKEAFHTVPSDSDEEDLIKPKSKSKTDNATEEQEYQHFLETSLQDRSSKKLLANLTSLASSAPSTLETEDDKEAFLANYLLNRGWLEPAAQKPLYEAEDDTSDDEKAEEFETQYNFRFEAPGAGELITHARTLSSARRGDERRKKERERKKAAKEAEKKKEMEEIARLRNLKRQELEERIRRIEGIAGAGGWTEKDLEGDFDPEEWDKRMQRVFDDHYYLDEDKKKPKFEDDVDITDVIGEDDMEDGENDEDGEVDALNLAIPLETQRKPTKREKLDEKRKIEEYLDDHLPFDKSKDEFHYREVSPDTFGLTPLDILTATDSQLNEFVGLKKLGPYRSQDTKARDKRKYGKKKRLREWRKKIAEEGEDEAVRAMLRTDTQEAAQPTAEENEPRKKKRKSRKKGAVEA